MEATTRGAFTLPTRRHASFVLLAVSISLSASGCGSGADEPDPTPTPTGCTSDAHCSATEYCELAGSSSAALLDPPCFFACLDAEMCMTPSCENACAESCGATCPEFCDFVCGGGAGAPPDALCVADCVPSCEADRMSTPPPPPPPPPPADAGTSTPPPPQDAGTSAPPAREGVCRARPTPPPPSDAGTPVPADSGPPPAEDAGTTPTPIAWAGTWNVRAVFTARCMWSSAGAPRDTALDYTVTARLSGANDDLTAVISTDYEMTGTGSDSGLTLSGQFPGRDHNDNAATTVRRDNQVSIRVREVIGTNEARGSIEGQYETSGGISCVIQDGGTVTFER